MSNEIEKTKTRRIYRKRRRAELEKETRRRIVEALVQLHGTIGASRTTIQDVASQAGVQRATVYRHFPDETSLFAACSEHWQGHNPLPNPAAWAATEDPDQRLRTALRELYAFFERNERMLDNNFRDEPRVEALRAPMREFRSYFRSAVEVLLTGRDGSGRDKARAALGHATSFSTWQSLVREQGLAPESAVEWMAALVGGAAAEGE